MLDEFCGRLSDKAQLSIALRLCRIALQIWDRFFSEDPTAVEKLNALIRPENRLRNAAERIGKDFPDYVLAAVEKSFNLAGDRTAPVAYMKGDPRLAALLATIMQPLTNDGWDGALPRSVRLVYTSVWNILTWILFRRSNEQGETHIYLAVNQAADALLSENIMTVDEINAILYEYQLDTRGPDEDSAWENAESALTAGEETLTSDEVYRKIIGENIVKDKPSRRAALEILRQMREEDKSFWDKWEEYYTGTCKTYSYNKEKNSFWLSEADVIVGSFFNEYPLSEEQMLESVTGFSLSDLRDNGFEV